MRISRYVCVRTARVGLAIANKAFRFRLNPAVQAFDEEQERAAEQMKALEFDPEELLARLDDEQQEEVENEGNATTKQMVQRLEIALHAYKADPDLKARVQVRSCWDRTQA